MQYLEQQEKIKAKNYVANPSIIPSSSMGPSMVEYKMEAPSNFETETTPRVEDQGFDAESMFIGNLTPNNHFTNNSQLLDRHSNIERIRKSQINQHQKS